MKKRLIIYFKKQVIVKKKVEKSLCEKYDYLYSSWQKGVEKNENYVRKKHKDAKHRECYEKLFPELRKQREERERLLNKYVFFLKELLTLFILFYFFQISRQFGRNISNIKNDDDDGGRDIFNY